ncbi:ABC transporter permease [candidate division KSB1 bacterium]|nr:ABC transporter permease [candidate division KSB1 bacterium]
MFKNYLKIALRLLQRQRAYAFVNIFGLAIGITCCLLISLYVQDELAYDRFHERADRIYRIQSDFFFQNDPAYRYVKAASAAGPELTEAFPEIEKFARFYRYEPTVAYQNRQFDEKHFFFADSTVFEIFSFPLLQGDAKTALVEPYTIVLTEETVAKYFGEQDPIGQRLTINDEYDVTVSAVMQNLPHNSHVKFDFLASFATFAARNPDYHRWTWDSFYTYLLLKKGTSATVLETKFPDEINRHFPKSWYKVLHLQPLTDIHLRSHYNSELEPNGSEKIAYIFSTIALLILLIACINFMNLNTARSASRAGEIGVRKVVGARQSQLISQFLGEALMVSFFAFLLALAIVEAALPVFNRFTGKEMALFNASQLPFILAFIAIVTLAGLVSGSYPAFFVASFRPVETLKGKMQTNPRSAIVRKSLVVLQFVISIVLIIATGVISQQIESMRKQNLGFKKEQVVVIPFGNSDAARQQREAFKSDILKNANVLSATVTSVVPGQRIGLLSTQVGKEADANRNIPVLVVDHDFVETYQVELVAGRNFLKTITSDATGSFLINETLVHELGCGAPEEALGRELNTSGNIGKVIGVVKDFHFQSLQHAISPIIFSMQRNWHDYLSARIATDDVTSTIAFLKNSWQAIDPARPFDFFFLDAFYDQQYRAEEKLEQIFGVFTALAIFIACLGLLGLAAFAAATRTKEIGIRKVLGAATPGIVMLLSKDFLKPVGIAFLLACPIAYFFMNKWLQDFAYRTDIGWWIFALAGGLALVIALLTVSTQAIKAALANPVEALRYE